MTNKSEKEASEKNPLSDKSKAEDIVGKRHCGIIMPIAPMPGYEGTHWSRVRDILDRAIDAAGFVPRLVSESEDIGVIHGRIVQNLYDDEVVVCDVSGKNANVMFELGLRLAFDKPTIIVKDDETGYSFDTSPIKHIGYRKDQRFDDVESFQKQLSSAIIATVEAKRKDADYSPFLRHFTKITPKTIEGKEIPQLDFLINQMDFMERSLNTIASKLIRDDALVNQFYGPDNTKGWITKALMRGDSGKHDEESLLSFLKNSAESVSAEEAFGSSQSRQNYEIPPRRP